MRITAFKVIAIIFLCAVLGNVYSQQITFEGKFAAINSEKIFNESVLAKESTAKLQSEFSPRQDYLRREAAQLRDAAQDFDKNSSQMTPELRQTNLAELKRRDLQLQEKQKKYTIDLNDRNFEERSKIAKVVDNWLQQVSELENILLVSQKAAYLAPESDITAEVTQLLNGTKSLKEISFQLPKYSTIAMVDPHKILKSAGFSDVPENDIGLIESRNKFLNKVNQVIKSIAVANRIDIIYQAGAFVRPNSDITEKTIELLNNSSSSPVVSNFKSPTAVAIVDSKKFFITYPNKNKEKLAQLANQEIAKIANKDGIDIVLIEAAYLNPKLDLTEKLLAAVIPPKEDEPKQLTIKEQKNDLGQNNSNFMEEYKNKCKELGFKSGTEGFGKCVLQLSK